MFGALLATARQARGLTQVGLANLLGVTSTTVSRWETERLRPEVSRLPDLAQALGLTVPTLYRALATSVETGVPPVKTNGRTPVQRDLADLELRLTERLDNLEHLLGRLLRQVAPEEAPLAGGAPSD